MFENTNFVDITQQCFALLTQVNFPANNLNFHWRWRWWDQIQAIFLNIFYFNYYKSSLILGDKDANKIEDSPDNDHEDREEVYTPSTSEVSSFYETYDPFEYMQTKAQRDFDEVFDEAEHIYSEPIYDTPSKGKYATPTKVPFIYCVSKCIAQNFI